jgi:hypothetical protein
LARLAALCNCVFLFLDVAYTNGTNVATKLKKIFGDADAKGMKDFSVQTARGWAFPPLADCRRMWAQRFGGRWNWHHNLEEWRTQSKSSWF